jgi:broad specificity phosphatase PhoE
VADRLTIVRHGETEWSKSGQHTSRTDLPLTDEGRAQARHAAHALAGIGYSLVLCSPLLRARETCELCGFRSAAQLTDDLHEWDYGEYEGLTSPQINETRPDWDLWTQGCPGGESPAQIGARVDRLLERVDGTEGDVLAFAHGHVLRVLAARWCELEVSAGQRFALATAGVGVLGHEHEARVLERWSI